jgi:hypothetical protein
MSVVGQKRRFGDVRVPSALALKADILRKRRHVSKVPTTEVADLFDHFVGARDQHGRNLNAGRLC